MVGARFVSASELAQGQRLDEQLVKDLTGGGDLVPARRLYKSEFTFKPALKLWFYGNAKPQVSGTDEGIWRRVRLIPFTVTIPEDEVDPRLPEKLEEELDGILAWAVRGCLEWQRQELGMPEEIKAATKAYREEEDVLARFLDECCVIDPKVSATGNTIHNAFTKWGGGWSMKALSKELKRRGYETYHAYDGNRYKGIGLLATDETPSL
jgi:putative DNA primase/helicase